MRDIVELLIGVSIFVAFAVVFTFAVSQPYCYARTAEMGIESRWGFWLGCQVEAEPGKWIPVDNYRYVEFEPQPTG